MRFGIYNKNCRGITLNILMLSMLSIFVYQSNAIAGGKGGGGNGGGNSGGASDSKGGNASDTGKANRGRKSDEIQNYLQNLDPENKPYDKWLMDLLEE